MMKLIPIVLACLAFFVAHDLEAQKKGKKNTTEVSNDAEPHEKAQLLATYHRARSYHDLEVATSVLYDWMLLEPENLTLRDSLVKIYFMRGMHVQVINVGRDILQGGTVTQQVLEYLALSEEQLGLHKEALAHFESLFVSTGNSYYHYRIATMQYALKRYGECENTLVALINDPKASDGVVAMNYGQGRMQNVPMNAVAWNLRGAVALDMNKPDIALYCFQEALKLAPDFQLALANLQGLTSKGDQADDTSGN